MIRIIHMTPQPGELYYHFKHDPAKGVNDHAYKIIGIARHTENNEVLVVYQPLYELDFNTEVGAQFSARPLSMFLEHVERDGYSGPRFVKIEDIGIIEELKNI